MTQMQTLKGAGGAFHALSSFLRGCHAETLPAETLQTAKLYLLDLIGVMIAADRLEASRIARNHAANHWAAGPGAPSAPLLLDGRHVSLPGFGFAVATQIDNLDAHDGWQPSKGHAGAALFPALAAFGFHTPQLSGPEALAALVAGYEISYRAALALHATVPDYHTSGAWNSLGCAAIGAKLRSAGDDVLRSALGIAEYHGPRSQMMREIANPSMLHDGTGWGAPTGIYALLIAEEGFQASPAATVEFDDAAFAWADLGQRWLTCEQYIKPYPICRWAHAAIDGARQLQGEYGFKHEDIRSVEIATFTQSAELNQGVPTDTTVAQYSISWPVAAMLVRGRVGVNEVLPGSFTDPDIISLTSKCRVSVDGEIDAGFPAMRQARVAITLESGDRHETGIVIASGGPDPQPTEEEVIAKYREFAGTRLSAERVHCVEQLVMTCDQPDSLFIGLLEELAKPG